MEEGWNGGSVLGSMDAAPVHSSKLSSAILHSSILAGWGQSSLRDRRSQPALPCAVERSAGRLRGARGFDETERRADVWAGLPGSAHPRAVFHAKGPPQGVSAAANSHDRLVAESWKPWHG
jgi:hypothetical protein